MFGKTKIASLFVMLTLLIASATAFALTPTTPCPTPYTHTSSSAWYGPYGSGSNQIVLAVAANFSGPMDAWLTAHFASSTTDKVYFCADSTGNLENTIGGNTQPYTGYPGTNNPYTMFFAADNTPQTYYYNVTPYLYAKGLPVLFGYISGNEFGYTDTIGSTGDLLTGANCTIANNQTALTPPNLDNCTISATLTTKTDSVALSIPSKAPYGNDAANILDLTYPIYPQTTYNVPISSLVAPGAISPATYVATENDPGWLIPSGTYANVTKAFQAVGSNNIYAGFAAMSEICNIKKDVQWVEFTDGNFILRQYAVSFAANDVNTTIKGEMANNYLVWNQFINPGWCYLSLP